MDDRLKQFRRFISRIEEGTNYRVYKSQARSHAGFPVYVAEAEEDAYDDQGYLVLTDDEANEELYAYINNETLSALDFLPQYELYDLVIRCIDDNLKDGFNREVKAKQNRELYPVYSALVQYLGIIDKRKLADLAKEKYNRAEFLSQEGNEYRMGDYYIYQLWGEE